MSTEAIQTIPAIEELLPHRRGMLFVEKILSIDELSSKCLITAGSGCVAPLDTNLIGTSVAVEYLAQASGLILGFRMLHCEHKPESGVLISVRKLISPTEGFSSGQILRAESILEAGDEETAQFEAKLFDHESSKVLISARLTIHVGARS